MRVNDVGGGRYMAGSTPSWKSMRSGASHQGLTLLHFSAQPKPFWSHLPVSPCLIDWGGINAQNISHKMCSR